LVLTTGQWFGSRLRTRYGGLWRRISAHVSTVVSPGLPQPSSYSHPSGGGLIPRFQQFPFLLQPRLRVARPRQQNDCISALRSRMLRTSMRSHLEYDAITSCRLQAPRYQGRM
jgi:hypothetical protein